MMPSKTFDIPASHVLEWPSDFTLLHYTSALTLHITFAIQGQIFSIVGGGRRVEVWFLCSSYLIPQHLRVITGVAVSSGAIHNCVLSSHAAAAKVFTFLFISLCSTHITPTQTNTPTHNHIDVSSQHFFWWYIKWCKVASRSMCTCMCVCVYVCLKQGPSTCAGWELIRLGPSLVSVAERCGWSSTLPCGGLGRLSSPTPWLKRGAVRRWGRLGPRYRN